MLNKIFKPRLRPSGLCSNSVLGFPGISSLEAVSMNLVIGFRILGFGT